MNIARLPIPIPPKTILLLGATAPLRPSTEPGIISGAAAAVKIPRRNPRRFKLAGLAAGLTISLEFFLNGVADMGQRSTLFGK
jgi:hypothetical protein